MNKATTDLIDAAFHRVDNARGTDPESRARRSAAQEYRNGVVDAVCAALGLDAEALMEEFAMRAFEAHEESIAATPMDWEG